MKTIFILLFLASSMAVGQLPELTRDAFNYYTPMPCLTVKNGEVVPCDSVWGTGGTRYMPLPMPPVRLSDCPYWRFNETTKKYESFCGDASVSDEPENPFLDSLLTWWKEYEVDCDHHQEWLRGHDGWENYVVERTLRRFMIFLDSRRKH